MIPRLIHRPARAARAAVLLLALAGCAAPPAYETRVLVMKPGSVPADAGLPPAGTTWRLEERELLSLSPAPYVPPPPSPIPMPPRIEDMPVAPYSVPYYGWGVPYYGPAFGFSFGYSHWHSRPHPSYPHRRWRR